MGISARLATREIGTALAVLAIYVLTLLLPLHQAAAQQRDLNALGYSTLSNWSVCAQLAQDEEGEPAGAAALTCPALGVAKQGLAATLPPALVVRPILVVEPVRYVPGSNLAAPAQPKHFGQSRAPPTKA